MKKLPSVPYTKKGFEEIKKEYQVLVDSRKDAVSTLSRARELGDLSENGFYKAAKGKLSSIDYNARRLTGLIKRAKVIESPLKGIIGIASKITVSEGKNIRNFHIVGKYESDPLKGKISNESPLGRALIGKIVGESVKVIIPNGEVVYKVLKIELSFLF